MNYYIPKSTQDYEKIINKGAFAVCMYTTAFCAPCKKIKPRFKEMASLNEDVNFIVADLETISVQDINAVPCFVIFKNGYQTFKGSGSAALKDVSLFLDYTTNK
jgi:thiol-disulfide isomerase/thioredoxin